MYKKGMKVKVKPNWICPEGTNGTVFKYMPMLPNCVIIRIPHPVHSGDYMLSCDEEELELLDDVVEVEKEFDVNT